MEGRGMRVRELVILIDGRRQFEATPSILNPTSNVLDLRWPRGQAESANIAMRGHVHPIIERTERP